jgi:hypothetical protein
MNGIESNTLVILSRDTWLIQQLNMIKKRYLPQLCIVEAKTTDDLFDELAFMAILDAGQLTQHAVEQLSSKLVTSLPNRKIHFRGYSKFSEVLDERFFIFDSKLFSAVGLRKEVIFFFNQANGKEIRKREYIEMIRRLIQKIDVWERNRDYSVIPLIGSKSTQRRDEKIIRTVEQLQIHPQKCKRTERILVAYLHYDEFHEIPRTEFCEKFEITLRTLNRDITVLGAAISTSFYYDEFTDCYK